MKRNIWTIFLCMFVLVLSLCTYASEAEYDGYIIKFKDEKSMQEAMDIINRTAFLCSDEEVVGEISEKRMLYTLDDENLLKEFEEKGLLEFSSPDVYCELLGYDYESEPKYSTQWALEAMNFKGAWDLGIYGNDVTVAVIDSGVNADHVDLKNRVLQGINVSDVTNYYDTNDELGHGSMVAGIIAAEVNGSTVMGGAHKVNIYPVKITNESKFQISYFLLGLENLAEEVLHEENGVYTSDIDVINMSIGVYSDSITTDAANEMTGYVNMFLDAGVILVSAAGNHKTTRYSLPACLDGVVCVSGTQKNTDGSYSYWADTENGTNYNDKVTICAPAKSITSTHVGSTIRTGTGSGTSFSSPYVAALAALAKAVDPSITPAHFTELLKNTANKTLLEGSERTDYYGYGHADAGALIKALVAEKYPDGYISPADTNMDGITSVTVYNPSLTSKNITYIGKSHIANRPYSFAVSSFTLAGKGTKELDITGLVLDASKSITTYMLDSVSLKPYCVVKTR